jgi:acetyl esterase/lipase
VRLEVRIALSLLRKGSEHSFGADPSQVGELHLPRGKGPHPVAVVLHGGYWQTEYGKLVTGRSRSTWPPAAGRRGTSSTAGSATGAAEAAAGRRPSRTSPTGIDHLAALDSPLDLSRVVLVGHSAGGQLALWAAARDRLPAGAVGAGPTVRAAAVVALAPVTNLERARVHAEQLLGGTTAQVPERWAQADPVRAGAPGIPALVVHPTADETVPVARSREYAARTGVPLVETAGKHRDPSTPSSEAWTAAVQWLEQHRTARPQ